MACEHQKLVRCADGVLRCMNCGEALDRPEEAGKEPEKAEKPAKRTTRKPKAD